MSNVVNAVVRGRIASMRYASDVLTQYVNMIRKADAFQKLRGVSGNLPVFDKDPGKWMDQLIALYPHQRLIIEERSRGEKTYRSALSLMVSRLKIGLNPSMLSDAGVNDASANTYKNFHAEKDHLRSVLEDARDILAVVIMAGFFLHLKRDGNGGYSFVKMTDKPPTF